VSRRDAYAVAPAVGLMLGLGLHHILLAPTWIGEGYDDGGYFLMSRNVWRYGRPVLDQHGSAQWPRSWSPALSLILSPFGALPMDAAIVTERVAVLLSGAAFVLLAYLWMRELGVRRTWAAVGSACVAGAFPTVNAASSVLSDLPAAAALLGGILCLRRGRLAQAMAWLTLAALLRPINGVVLAAAAVWLLLQRPSRRVVLGVGALATVVAGLVAVQFAAGGFSRYLTQLTTGANTGSVPTRLYHNGKAMVTGATGETLAGVWGTRTLLDHVRPLLTVAFVLLVAAAAIGFWRRRALLEALVIVATVAVLLVYPSGPSLTRYLIPLAPLLVGGIAVALQDRRRVVVVAAAAAAFVALASDVRLYDKLTGNRFAPERSVAAKRAVYRWVRADLPRSAKLVSWNDIQTFLYTDRPATRSLEGYVPGRTYDIDPFPLAPFRRLGLERFRIRTVFRAGPITVVRIDGPR
jgi:hypothetical protein